ncbi:MAG: hypothetical protein II326_02590 [Clostridia bacterium]|nr:hypothetical protein [Clostridia bacterium]
MRQTLFFLNYTAEEGLDFVTFSANVKKWKKEKEEKWDKRLEARRKAGKMPEHRPFCLSFCAKKAALKHPFPLFSPKNAFFSKKPKSS